MNNFFKKYWYKFLNKEKYEKLKIYENNKKDLSIFKKNYENYINLIQKKIKEKKELNFLHSGTSGDIINSLPIIKELSKTHKCNFYLQSNKAHNNKHPNNYGIYLMNENTLNMLLPLLKTQKYLNSVNKYSSENIDIDFDIFRKLPISFVFDNARYYFQLVGIQPNLLETYLDIEKHDEIKNQIVIHRTLRYQNHFINYKFLNSYENLLFVGSKKEYEDLKKDITNLKFYDCKDFLEMAKIIKSSKLFIGNSSIGHALAEAIKIPRLLEACPGFPAAQPHGKNAFDFYFQIHFEKFFKKLYEISL